MRHLLVAVVIAASGLCVTGQAADIDPQERNWLHAVDWSAKQVVFFQVGQESVAYRISLDDQPYLPFGVTFGNSIESNCGGVSFVTQGPLLRVIDQAQSGPRATLNVAERSGLTSLYLRRLEANRFSASDGTEIDLLYVIGEHLVDTHVPWLFVFDETVLLTDPLDAGAALVAAAPLCADCSGLGLDVAVQDPVAYSGEQESYASVLLQSEPELHQRFFRIVLHESDQDHEDYWLEVSHQPTSEDGIAFSGFSMLAMGLDYGTCDGDQVPFGVLKSSSAVIDLSTGVPSCALGGSPSDVVVSSPSSNLEHESYHFVTTHDGVYGHLLGFPVGGCPDGGADSIQVPIAAFPQASVVVLEISSTPWIYTVGSAGISGVHLEFSSDAETGDQITALKSFIIDESGSHTSVDATFCPDKSGAVIPPETIWPDPCDDPENDDPNCDDDDDDPRPGGSKVNPHLQEI